MLAISVLKIGSKCSFACRKLRFLANFCLELAALMTNLQPINHKLQQH